MADRFVWVAWPARALLLVLCLAVPAVLPVPCSAEEEPTEPAPAEDRSGKEAVPPLTFLDVAHSSIERNFLKEVIWFDDFFGSPRTEETRETRYVLRWKNSLRWDEGGRFRFRTSLRANIRLPRISERTRIIISGENEAEPPTGLPEDPGNPGFDQTLQNTRLVNTEIRYIILKRPLTNLFLGAGVRIKLPFESFVRSRFQHTRPLGPSTLVRFGETLFWKDAEGFGETTEIDLERRLGKKMLLRWANSGTLSEERQGLEWGTGLSLQWAFSTRNVITPGGSISGRTRPSAVIEGYRVSLAFRRNVHKDWLFFELEPEITWSRTDAGGYPPAYASTFRIEVLFQGSDRTSE